MIVGAQGATDAGKPMVFALFSCLSGSGRRAERKVGEGTKGVPPTVWQLIGGTRLQHVRGNTGRHFPSFWSLLGHSGCHFGLTLGSFGLA